MAQKDDIMRNVAKVATYAGLAWIGYKIVQGLSKNQSATQIVQETVKPIEKAASEIKSISKKLLKGSPEAKERMKKLREMNKTPRGQGIRAKRTATKMSKVQAGEKGGEVTAEKGEHKGHSSKKGLVQDQSKTSSEKHEKHYRKSKKKKR